MHRVPVETIMQRDLITVHPDALAADAAELMEIHQLRRLPVLADGRLVGIVTDSDLLEAETAESTFHSMEPGVEEEWLTVSDVMSRNVITIEPGATIGQLVLLMMQHKVGGIPVILAGSEPQQNTLVGIVTETDVFAYIAAAWEEEERSASMS